MAPRSDDGTRIVRLGLSVDREEARNEGTRCMPAVRMSHRLNLRTIFNASQVEMARAINAEKRLGLMLFVLGRKGVEGSLWLSATDQMRAGTVGRHGCADLYLPSEEALSLRHCLVLVRSAGDGIRVHVVDLSSSAGLTLEDEQPVSALDADGHFFLRVPGAILACIPTGMGLPWNADSVPAYASLGPRKIVKQLDRAPRLLGRLFERESDDVSHVTLRQAPVAALPVRGALLAPGEVPAGMLELSSPSGREVLEVGLSSLDRGVVLGRSDRCAGCGALSHDSVSRVHALLIRRDERLYIADAGSTNGIWLEEEEVKCASVAAGAKYHLGEHASLIWKPLD